MILARINVKLANLVSAGKYQGQVMMCRNPEQICGRHTQRSQDIQHYDAHKYLAVLSAVAAPDYPVLRMKMLGKK